MSQERTNFIHRDESFNCEHCGEKISPLGKGCRNHCPFCLYSKHVDEKVPGDRKSDCEGLMKPLNLESGSRKGYLGYDILHKCKRCGKQIKNMLAEDDDWGVLSKE